METEKVPMALWTGGEQTKEPVRLRVSQFASPTPASPLPVWLSGPGHLLDISWRERVPGRWRRAP